VFTIESKIYITDNFYPRMLSREMQSSRYFKRYLEPFTTVDIIKIINDKLDRKSKLVSKIIDSSKAQIFSNVLNTEIETVSNNDISLDDSDIIILGEVLNMDRKPYNLTDINDYTILPEDLKIEWWVI